ncbi:MAG: putative addiction module antidote protein [Deltaproteobacteria bacterium]|nr:putative addiction module antidote protein [Deltaproteobacteria bacterium]
MALKTKPFDVAEHLETQEDIKTFLQDAAEGTPEEFIHALNTAARAMGMTEVAKKAGVTRASLYKSLSDEGNPQFSTISKVTKALGCKLAVA